MKKLLILITITILIFLPVTVFSASSGICGDNLNWTLDGDTLTISGTGDMWNYFVNDMPWASFHSNIEKVIIGNNVASIGSYAFYKFTNLVDLTIGNSVKKIGERAFSSCAFKNLTLPDGLTVINDYAFYDCADLISITIPYNITHVGLFTFSRCDNLTSLYIPLTFKDKNIYYDTDRIVYYSAATCDNGIKYSFDFTAVPELSGNLYVAAYDSTDKLLSVNVQKPSGTLTFNGTAAYCRAFLWDNNNMPISATDKIIPKQ